MKTVFINILFLAFAIAASSQQTTFYSNFVLDVNRAEFDAKIENDILSFDPACNDEGRIKSFAWAVAAFNKYDMAAGKIDSLAQRFGRLPAQSRYDVLSLVFGYGGLSSAGRDSIAANILPGSGMMSDLLSGSFLEEYGYEAPPSLMSEEVAAYRDGSYHRELNCEEFEVLFRHCKEMEALLLILRADRNLPGKMLVPCGDGYHEPLLFLGRSAYNTPSFVRNGNTPCGVYTVRGTGVSENVFIGPTPFINTYLPFEATPAEFALEYPEWTSEVYDEFLPETLRDMPMMLQAYHAGKNGRGDIIIHGSTIDPGFFRGTAFYPLTPSMGCMTALQVWDGERGTPVEGQDAQARLLEVLTSDIRYLYVTQVDEKVMNNFK